MSGRGGHPSPHLRQFAPVKYKKAPQAPRRFKSSYMFFSTTKHKEIRAELTAKGEGKLPTTEVAKMVSHAWKALPEDEREKWEEMARQDKARYEMEKSMYTGPWKVPAQTKRVSKDPRAPKRPMSAFLSFSNSKRSYVKSLHPDARNSDISKILAQMWKDANPEEKQVFIDKEFRLRQNYKLLMSEWKRENEEEFRVKREERENEAMQAIRDGKVPLRPDEQLPYHQNKSNRSSASSYHHPTAAVDAAARLSSSTHHSLGLSRAAAAGLKYNTNMATETFAPSLSNPYPLPHPSQQQLAAISGGGGIGGGGGSASLPVPSAYSSYATDDYQQYQQHPHPQHYPPSAASASASASLHYNPDHSQLQSSSAAAAAAAMDAYNNNVANSYRSQYGGVSHPYPATSSPSPNMTNPYDPTTTTTTTTTTPTSNPYDRRAYDPTAIPTTGGGIGDIGTGYDTYGQPQSNPYGYAPSSYYPQQGTYPSTASPGTYPSATDNHQQQQQQQLSEQHNVLGGNSSQPPPPSSSSYYHYDPNHSFDPNNPRSPSQP
mmetsp:Transcript_35912/g.41027  ORF Transcript_35912/g.41027 Transcript_35912/m.41027 type:complete len:545 (-) Transcript_35912:415-2049(-)